MTVSSGFFNSVNHDRLYDATQLSSIFDGIIKDGVYQGIGKALKVSAKTDSNSTVIIGAGRAWFDHTWILNDSDYTLALKSPNEFLGRIDAIVLDINREEDVRNGEIKYIPGTFNSNPQKPELIKSTLHNQYPLAYITIKPGSDAPISNANIEICVGTDACPLVTGLLEVINSDVFMQQVKGEFNDWFNGIKDLVDENTALKLQNQIDEINNKIENSPTLGVPKEAYEYATEWECYTDKTNANPLLFIDPTDSIFLPDGFIFSVGPINKQDSSASGRGQYVCARIIDKNLTLVSTTLLQTLNSTNYVTRAPWIIGIDTDSYPVKLKIFVDGTVKNGDTLEKHGIYMIDVTISNSHTISKTVTSKVTTQSNYIGDGTPYTDWTNPVKLNDGSYVMCTSYTDSHRGISSIYGFLYKISSSGTITEKALSEVLISSWITSAYNTLMVSNDEQMAYLVVSDSYGIIFEPSSLNKIGSIGSSNYPMEPDPSKVKKPLDFGDYVYDSKTNYKYYQNSESINIETGTMIPLTFFFNGSNEFLSGIDRKVISPDGKFMFYDIVTNSSYNYNDVYHSYIDINKGFSITYNHYDTNTDYYRIPYFSCQKNRYYYDESLKEFRYLFGLSIGINTDYKSSSGSKLSAFSIGDFNRGILVIKRKES